MPVILIRHGQSEGNLKRIFQGSLDYPLTGLGREQARSAGRWLASQFIQFDAVVTSPLQRAAVTAGIISAETDSPEPTVIEQLREIHGGELQGLTTDECNTRFPGYNDRGLPHTADFSEYGGESYEQVNARIQEVISLVQRSHAEPQTVGIVAHGGTLYQLLKAWCGWPVPRHFFVGMGNCVMICLEQRKIRGHLGAQLKWMIPLELVDGSLSTEWRLADSPAEE